MGVDYSTTLGYGVTLEKIPSFISPEKWVEESEVDIWLEKSGYTNLEFEMCGNWMSGAHIYLFCVKGTNQRLDPMYDKGVLSFNQPELAPESAFQLRGLCHELGLDWAEDISWKLIFNVS